MLYPLQFHPIFKYRIWGGNQLKEILQKNTTASNIGESWEISNVEGSVSKVRQGALENSSLRDLIKKYKGDLLGKAVYRKFKMNFPLLIKYIDAKLPLSVQVHPGDELAEKRHQSFGKNEMWYIMKAEADATLVMGLKEGVSKRNYKEAVVNQEMGALLNYIPVNEGDTFYIPAGKVHAIGAGILLAEIQQSSDITYRIYDYDRVDSQTKQKRELHLEEALDAIDFNSNDNKAASYLKKPNSVQPLVHSPYFTTDIIEIAGEIEENTSNLDSFIIYMNVGANPVDFTVGADRYLIKGGETILIPAIFKQFSITSDENSTTLLKVYMTLDT